MGVSGTTVSSAQLAGIYKDYYANPDVLGDVVYKKNKLLTLLDNPTDLAGDFHKVPILSGYPQNSSGDGSVSFDTSVATSSIVTNAFFIPPISALNGTNINRRDNVMSRNDQGAFVKLATEVSNALLKGRAMQTEMELFRDGWGDIGVIDGNYVSGTSFTLSEADDIVNFQVNQKLVFAASQSSDALRSGTAVTVTTVGTRNNPVVTVSAAPSGLGVEAGDWIFLDGCRQNSATPSMQVVAGLGAFLPASNSPGTLFGLDRSSNPSALAGQYVDANNGNLKQGINDLLAQCVGYGGDPDVLLMNTFTWGKFQSQNQVNVVNVNLKRNADITIGAASYEVNFDQGTVNIVTSPFCPSTKVYALTMDTWKFHTAEKAFGIFMDDEMMVRVNAADAYSIRGGGYHSLYTNEPGHNGVLTNFQIG